MNKLTRALACFLLAVLSFYIVPKEFVHTLFGHEDTADHVLVAKGRSAATFSTQHTHCELLNFETDFFYEHTSTSTPSSPGILFSYFPLPLNTTGLSSSTYVSLRGPPCC
jgi:hypothetical protein